MEYKQALPRPILVGSADAYKEMLSHLMGVPAIAVDTESNSLYAYNERVCLIQFSIPGFDYLLDPLSVHDLGELGDLFARPDIEKVFHAAEYDVMSLHRDYGFGFVNLFDTMIASRIVGWRRFGLGTLLEEHFGVVTDKRMQRTNWGKRPLSREQLAYAQLDSHFLVLLRDMLMAELIAKERVQEARAAFARVAESRWNGRPFDPDGFWRIKETRTLDGVGLAVLRALYIYRDQRAQVLDRPSFKVLSDDVLVALSRRRPRTLEELDQLKGMPRHLSVKHRRQLLDVVAQGLQAPVPHRAERDHNGRPSEVVERRYEALREWRQVRAQARGVEPDVVLSNQILHQLARHNPTSLAGLEALSVLNEWERQAYGDEVVALLRDGQT